MNCFEYKNMFFRQQGDYTSNLLDEIEIIPQCTRAKSYYYAHSHLHLRLG